MNPIYTGTRFKMRFEVDDSPERRCVNFKHHVLEPSLLRLTNN